MKKLTFIIAVISMLIGGSALPLGGQTLPPVQVSLSLFTPEKTVYFPGDPLRMRISLVNSYGNPIAVPEGFSSRSFIGDLVFTNQDGTVVTAISAEPARTPDPPRIIIQGDQYIQGEPVEILPASWVLNFPEFNALDYYDLTRGGLYSVKVRIPVTIYNPPQGDFRIVPFSPNIWNETENGPLESGAVNFTLVRDWDGDGYHYPLPNIGQAQADCNDQNANVSPGKTEIAGNGLDDDCNPETLDAVLPPPKGTIQVKAEKHLVGSGSKPLINKEPLTNLSLRIYDKSPGSCVSRYGVSWHHYPPIWLSCPPVPDGSGITNSLGIVEFSLAPGNYLVIGQYDPSTIPEEKIYLGVSAGELYPGATLKKYLQLIVKVDGKKVPAKYSVLTGSDLLVIEPEYIEWDGTQELYPFIFESVGDWSVTTSVAPPEGFVSDYKALSAEVNTDLKAVQFTITDLGSKWVSTKVEHRIKHKGKNQTVRSVVGIKLSDRLARHKNLGRFGDETTKQFK